MEKISITKRKYKNANNYKYISNQEEKHNEFELISEKIYDYKINNELKAKENKGFSNGIRQDKTMQSNNNDSISSYYINSKNHPKLNQYCFDNNNYNIHESNDGGNIYHTQLRCDKNNIPIYGNMGNNSIKYINYSNKSQIKKDPNKLSNIAKALKYINNKENYINYKYEDKSGNTKNYIINQKVLKSELSNDKAKIGKDYRSSMAIWNLDIQTNKKSSNKNEENIGLKVDLKYKYVEEENKSKTPLKVNSRKIQNNNKTILIDKNIENNSHLNNLIIGGESNINHFTPEDISLRIKENAVTNRIKRKDNKEINKQDYSDRDNKKKINNYNNIRNYNSHNDYITDLNNIQKNNEKININNKANNIKSITETNFSNKKNKFAKSAQDIFKNVKQSNLNNKTLQTLISIKENYENKNNNSVIFPNNCYQRNLKTTENTPINNYSSKEMNNFLNERSSSSHNKKTAQKIRIDLNKYNKKEEKKIDKDKITNNNIMNNNNKTNIKYKDNQKVEINEKIKDKMKQTKHHIIDKINIKINSINQSNNIVRINGIENNKNNNNINSINKNNKIINFDKHNNNNKIIFQKKVNRSPPGFNKITYKQRNNINEFNPNIKSLLNSINNNEEINSNILKEEENINEKINLKTENNLNSYINSKKIKSNNTQELDKYIIKDNRNSKDSFMHLNTQNGSNGNIYIKQKPLKKYSVKKQITKGKLDIKAINEKKEKSIYNNDKLLNYQIKEIRNKISINNYRISKYYDFFINLPKVERCNFSNIFFKEIKLPKIERCRISKINSVIYILYKCKSVCYCKKVREIIKKIANPPVNEICECSKNIVLSKPNLRKKPEEKKKLDEPKKIEMEIKTQIIAQKKQKKRKKRRKTRRLHNSKEAYPNLNQNTIEKMQDEEKIEYENIGNNINMEKKEINEKINTKNKEIKEEKEKKNDKKKILTHHRGDNHEDEEASGDDENKKKKEEKIGAEKGKQKIINYNGNINNLENNINKTKELEKISLINSNSIFNMNNILENKQNKSSIYKSSNEENDFSEKEIIISDLEKNNSIRKKLSTESYNFEYNEEENDDFRIASDDDDLSGSKINKNEFKKQNKTEGKEILVDYDINKSNKNFEKKNKMSNFEKKIRALELLEKIQDKRNLIKNKEYIFYKNEKYDSNVENNNYGAINKNILLGTNKLNEIFNNQKNLRYSSNEDNKYNQEEIDSKNEDIYIDSNIIYSDDDIKSKENKKEILINYNENYMKKQNNTFKKKLDYEKIGYVFDKLEGILYVKNINKNSINNSKNNNNIEKCKTPLLNNEELHIKNKISDFNLKEIDSIYNKKRYKKEINNFINDNNENENNSNNYNEKIEQIEENIEINEENFEEEKSEEKKNIDVDKYKEIFDKKQQILLKLEILMKNKANPINNNSNSNINNYIFNSPKIENGIDDDININKDTPGNRKEIKKNNFLINKTNINNSKYINKYTLEEILSYKNIIICLNTNLLPINVINHCNEILSSLQEKIFYVKTNHKDIIINKNTNYIRNNIIIKTEKEPPIGKWARKDMTKEIEIAEKYLKELNSKMSQDNYKYEIIEILNTLTVDNYKNTLKKMIKMLFLSDKNDNNKIILNKPEYILYNQCIFVEIILDKATIEKGYTVLYAKLCADLFIELIKLMKENNNPEIENQLINGENLKTILTSECRQRFDECVNISTISQKIGEDEKNEMFLLFKKKFLGNMNFIAELINVKIISQTKGFEFLDILYKRYNEVKNNETIKFLNLEGAITLLTKFGKIVMKRQNQKHIQNLENYIKDNIIPIISSENNESNNIPNYLKFKIINLIEKKKNNWIDSLYEQSIVAKGKANNINNICLYNEGSDSIVNIDESLMDYQKTINNNKNNNNQDKEENLIILLKNDIENYKSFLNEHDIFNKNDLNKYCSKNENRDINNEYNWFISEELIIKTNNELEEIIRYYIEVCIDYVNIENNIFYCNEYIKNIINYYSVNLNKDEIEKVNFNMNELFLNIEDICIDNKYMIQIMGYLLLILLNNNLFYIEDFEKFNNEDKNRIITISQVIKFSIVHSDGKYEEMLNKFKNIKLFNDNKNILEENIVNPLKNVFNLNLD